MQLKPALRKDPLFPDRNWFVVFSLVCLVFFFSWGVLSTYYRFFPFQQIVFIKRLVAGKTNKVYAGDVTPVYEIRADFFSSVHTNAKNVMVGDSLTHFAEWHELFPGASILNRGIGRDTTSGVLKRLDSIIAARPENAFVMLGINEILGNRPEEEILRDYVGILKILQSSKITPIVESTLYVVKGYPDSERVNAEVKRLNDDLLAYAGTNNMVFVNLNDGLSAGGNLRENLSIDGVHLNWDGYKIWKSAIELYVKQ